MAEQVNHPEHYGGADNPYEVIKVIEAWELDFHLGNSVKYIARAGLKCASKRLEDLEKARWYLDRKIEQVRALEAEAFATLDAMGARTRGEEAPDA